MQDNEQQINKKEVWEQYKQGATTTELAELYGVSQPTISRWLAKYKASNCTLEEQQDNARKVLRHFSQKWENMNALTDQVFNEDVDRAVMVKWGILYDKFQSLVTLDLQDKRLELERLKIEMKQPQEQETPTHIVIVDDVRHNQEV